jgi:hypothetical protein
MSDTQELTSMRDKKTATVAVDQAWDYLENHGDAPFTAEPFSLKALRRKIDWRIVPLMFCCYTMQFIDKVLINVSGEFLPISLSENRCSTALSSTLLSWA